MKLPKTVREEIVRLVEERADQHSYMSRSRTENREFMQALTNDPSIGGRLSDFMPKERIRIYIKDSILNAYAKQKNYGRERPDYEKLLTNHFRETVSLIESTGGALTPTLVCLSHSGQYMVAKVGSFLKWETAVKHVVEYLVKTNHLGGTTPIRKLIILQGDHESSNSAQRRAMIDALKIIDFEVLFA